MNVARPVRLLVRPERAVALAIGHRDAEREVLRVHAVDVSGGARGIAGSLVGIDAMRGLPDRGERVAAEIALRAAGLLT